MNLDQKTKEIQMSVAYNNATRIVKHITGANLKPEGIAHIAFQVDLLARELYQKQIKFLNEINEPES